MIGIETSLLYAVTAFTGLNPGDLKSLMDLPKADQLQAIEENPEYARWVILLGAAYSLAYLSALPLNLVRGYVYQYVDMFSVKKSLEPAFDGLAAVDEFMQRCFRPEYALLLDAAVPAPFGLVPEAVQGCADSETRISESTLGSLGRHC